MEGQTQGLVSLLSAGVVEQVRHDIITDGEQSTARRVGRDMARRALNAAGEGS